MAKIVTVEEMIAIEKKADAAGLTYDQMMENAGKSIANHILTRWSDTDKSKFLILVGPGNNGGDGLVAGYHLSLAGAEVSYYLFRERTPDDVNFTRVQKTQAQITIHPEDERYKTLNALIDSSDIIIDGLLGTGFKLPLKGDVAKIHDDLEHLISHSKVCNDLIKDSNLREATELFKHIDQIDKFIHEVETHISHINDHIEQDPTRSITKEPLDIDDLKHDAMQTSMDLKDIHANIEHLIIHANMCVDIMAPKAE